MMLKLTTYQTRFPIKLSFLVSASVFLVGCIQWDREQVAVKPEVFLSVKYDSNVIDARGARRCAQGSNAQSGDGRGTSTPNCEGFIEARYETRINNTWVQVRRDRNGGWVPVSEAEERKALANGTNSPGDDSGGGGHY